MTVRRSTLADTDAVLTALVGAALLWLETVTNPLLAVADLPVLIAAAHAAGRLRRGRRDVVDAAQRPAPRPRAQTSSCTR